MSCATYLHIAGSVKDLNEAMYANPEQFIKKGVQMRMQHDVIEIDSTAHTILAQDLQTKEFVHDKYDKLIMTTGSKTTIPVIPGIESTKVMLCKTCDQAQKLYKASKNAETIAILGGGYSGVELAEGYLKSGHQVILFQRKKQLLNQYLDTTIAQKVKKITIRQ
ncbi:NADH oxidase [Companilactobacillus farciminis]|nr:NADH oxidase [Companilactobacillus farciminis]